MPPEEKTGGTPEGSGGGTPPSDTPAGGSGGGTPPGRNAADYEREITALKDETITRRKRIDELETKLKGFEDAQLTETQKLQKAAQDAADRAKAAEGRARAAEVRSAIERSARKLNIVDEDAAYRLLDRDRIEFEGESPKNVDALLQQLVKERPYLVGQQQTSGGSTANPPRDGTRTLTRDEISKMTPEQVNANWDAVQRALNDMR